MEFEIRNSSDCYLCLLLFDYRKTFISFHLKGGGGLFLKQNTFLKFDIVRRQFTLSFSKWCSKCKIVRGQQKAISYPTDSSDLKYINTCSLYSHPLPLQKKKYPQSLPHGRRTLQVKNRTLCIKQQCTTTMKVRKKILQNSIHSTSCMCPSCQYPKAWPASHELQNFDEGLFGKPDSSIQYISHYCGTLWSNWPNP